MRSFLFHLLLYTFIWYYVSGHGLFDKFDSLGIEADYDGSHWHAPSRLAHLYSRRKPKDLSSLRINKSGRQGESFRLPGELKPISYDLFLSPNLDPNVFSTYGTVRIRFQCIKKTNNITFNAADLLINTNSISVLLFLNTSFLTKD